MKKALKFWDSLESREKMILIIVVVVILWISRNKIKGFLNAAGKNLQNQSEISKLQSNGIKATYDAEKYQKLADYLFRAMDGVGTYVQDVYNAFNQLRNDVDFIKLDTAFGVRTPTDTWFGLAGSHDLKTWIKEDLSESEVSTLNNLLKNRGVSKRF